MSEPLLEIRRRIAASRHPILDRKVLLQTNTRQAFDIEFLGKMVTAEGESSTTGYFNVAIEAMIAVGRASSVMEVGDTWRDVVNLRLHGEDWRPETLTYFDSEIRDQLFPASGAKGLLKLNTVAGAVSCSNGNHRCAATVAWIAATRPETPFLWKAILHVAPVHQGLVDWLLSRHAAGSRLHYLQTYEDHRWLVRVEHWGYVAEYEVLHGTVRRLQRRPKIPGTFSDVKAHEKYGAWSVMPAAVLRAWASNSWLRSQLANRTWEPLSSQNSDWG